MKKRISLIVYGEPTGKGRPKFSTFGGFVKTYTPQETTNYESSVRFAYKQAQESSDFTPFDAHEMVKATIIAYFQIPKGRYKYHKKTNTTDLDKTGLEMEKNIVRPTKKPDCDNIAKICLDALNGLAYVDDSQITSLSVSKLYSKEPKVVIILEEEIIETNEILF